MANKYVKKFLTSLATIKMTIKSTRRWHYKPTRTPKMQNEENSNYWWDSRANGTPYRAGRSLNLKNQFEKWFWCTYSSKHMHTLEPSNSHVSIPGHSSICSPKKSTRIFLVVLLLPVLTWNSHKYSSTEEWMSKLCYVPTRKHYTGMSMNIYNHRQ